MDYCAEFVFKVEPLRTKVSRELSLVMLRPMLPVLTSFSMDWPVIVTHLIIWILAKHTDLTHTSDVAQPALELTALDCTSPTRTRYSKLSEVCTGHTEQARPLGEPNPVLVIQLAQEKVITGYRCRRTESNFYDLCAVWGHVKRYGPPQIEHAAPISPAQCHSIVTRGTYKREDGGQINIEVNSRKSYTMIRHGHLYLSANNVACSGASVTLARGETVSGIIESISVTITVQQIQIEVAPDHLTDLDEHISIPTACNDASGCQAGHTAYIIPELGSKCPLYSIRVIQLQETTINTQAGPQPALVNMKHKVIFVTGRSEPSPAGCPQSFNMISTQYRQLRLIKEQSDQAAVQTLADGLPPSSLDLDLEIRTSEEYLSYRFERLFSHQIAETGQQLCTVAAHSLQHAELSPFAKDSIIRVRGDILQELQCNKVTVSARLGDQRGKVAQCSSALPVWHGTKPVWLQASSHLLLPASEIDAVACSAAYVPLFLTNVGSIIMADPIVRVVDITLDTLPSLFNANTSVLHQGFATDLIYTSQEVKKFNHLLHFSRSRHRLLDSITQRICETPNACGGYQAPEGSSGFSLSQLETSITHPFTSVFSSLNTMLTTVGGYCSLIIMGYCFISLGIRIFRLMRILSTPHNFMTRRQALRLAFFPAEDYAAAATSNMRNYKPHEGPDMLGQEEDGRSGLL